LTELIRRFRGLGVAIVVLAMSAGVVFASAPPFAPASSDTNPAANANSDQEDASEEPSEDPTESPSDDPSEEPSEDPTEDSTASAPAAAAPTAEADETGAPEDTHGALVSAAAHMDLPEGFANRGAFVSCVAHMKDGTLATVVLADVTPDLCATIKATPPGKATSEAAKTKAQEKATAGKAKGQDKAAAAKAKHQH